MLLICYPVASRMGMGHKQRRVLLVLLFAASIGLASCGNPRPPEPPSLELPRAVRDLRARRKGGQVQLTWTKPQRTTEGETILYLGPTRICRSLAPLLRDCGTPVGEVPPAPHSSSSSSMQKQKAPKLPLQVHLSSTADGSYADTLPAANISDPDAEYTYALEVLNQAQRSAGLSNRVHVSAVPTLPPPADFHAQLSSSGVQLSWSVPQSTPSDTNRLRHVIRIYRQEQGEPKDQRPNRDVIIAALPLSATQYLDAGIEWEKTYSYHATVASVVQSTECSNVSNAAECKTEYIEGDDNPSVTVFAHDVFPPETPTGLQVVFGGTDSRLVMDLVWNPDTDSDLAGYNVYRQQPGGEWEKINATLVKTSAYYDAGVAAGKTYNYSVSAVDVHGNQSARSIPAQETVPSQP